MQQLQLVGTTEEQLTQALAAIPKILALANSKTQRITVLEQEHQKKNDEITLIQNQFKEQMQQHTVLMQEELQKKQKIIEQLGEKLAMSQNLLENARVQVSEAKINQERSNSKYEELEQLCV